jgi:hypothetical protein
VEVELFGSLVLVDWEVNLLVDRECRLLGLLDHPGHRLSFCSIRVVSLLAFEAA